MINKIKKIKAEDFLGIFKFLIVLIPAMITKIILHLTKRKIFLVCETKDTARDNGFIFYKYMKKQHSEIASFYAINKKSEDYKKVKDFGSIIQWGSIKHYYYYMSSTHNISSHKEGNPNHPLFTVLHLYLHLYNNRTFLQHGVLYTNLKMFHNENTKFKLFITGAQPEYEFVLNKFGYKKNQVKYTGLARFDNLYNIKVDKSIILLIPTWRRWLDTEDKFEKSKYYKRLYSLINNESLINMLEKNDKYLYFYPHQSTREFVHLYKNFNKRIKILDYSTTDIQELLKKSALMITDFSSVATDFAYMNKPIIYYQYDFDEFITQHENGEAYFDFKKDGFGEVVSDEKELIKSIEKYIVSDFKLEKKYLDKINKFFVLHDNKNCERIFKEIIGDNNEK